jgi:hypothetical protein
MAAVNHMAMNHRIANRHLLFVAGSASSGDLHVFEFTPGVGYGTKLATVTTGQTNAPQDAIVTNAAGTMLAQGSSGSAPWLHLYAISRDGIGTKFSNPPANATGSSRQVNFSPSGNALVMGHNTTPFVISYSITDSGFGTRYANPTNLPGGASVGAGWTRAGDEILLLNSASTPRAAVYPWTAAGGFGTRRANSYSESTRIGTTSATWSSNGLWVVTGGSGAGTQGPYALGRAAGQGFSNTTVAAEQLPNFSYYVKFNHTDGSFNIGTGVTPWVVAYQWSNATGIGSRYANAATLTGNNIRDLHYTITGTDVVGSGGTNPPSTHAWRWTDAGGWGTKYTNASPAIGNASIGSALQPFYP